MTGRPILALDLDGVVNGLRLDPDAPGHRIAHWPKGTNSVIEVVWREQVIDTISRW